MKSILFTLLLALSFGAAADQFVRGHTRSDGTYVAPYHRSSPDSRRYNNYSSQGNSNPYTGERYMLTPRQNTGAPPPW